MPFSQTTSCSEEEWTEIFENIFKPAVEKAGLGYTCRMSTATRGNIVASIIRELNDAHVVVADLTDRNANVFYELGVRHSLKNRTILLAQQREDIPFDLQAYASHVYDWKTQLGKDELTQNLRVLLGDIDASPERPDNPVSDFLGGASATTEPELEIPTPEEAPFAQSLFGPGADGLDAVGLARRLANEPQPRAARTVYRLTRQALRPVMEATLVELNSRPGGSINQSEILDKAREFIGELEPFVERIEEFCLASIEEDWSSGLDVGFRFVSDWITLSEQAPQDGQSIRFARGAPALLAWRLIVLMGAKALAEQAFALLSRLLTEPIEVEEMGGQFSNRPFLQRQDLFYPEAFLGHADIGIQYVSDLWETQPHIQKFFDSQGEYHMQLATLLMVNALSDARQDNERLLWPGYKRIPQAHRAMNALKSRLATPGVFRQFMTMVLEMDPTNLDRVWPDLAAKANSAPGGQMLGGTSFPNAIG